LAEVGFYHLTRTGPDAALPKLLGRTLAAGQRAAVVCGGDERVAALDAALWLCPEPDWLPHGTRAVGNADLQPIWLATDDTAPNGARFLFLLDGADSARIGAFERVLICSTAATRRRWPPRGCAGRRQSRPATR
jgi:DNA polymerase-3 subunit chi